MMKQSQLFIMLKMFECFSSYMQACAPIQLMTSGLVTLDEGVSYVYSTEGLNSNDENSALLHIIQIHQDDITLNVQLQLLAFIAWHEAFHQLRTVEQLGYVCLVTHRYDLGVHGLQFIVLSAVKVHRHTGPELS
ncbi:insulin-degrading enzyme-like 1, peroxisomal isoform X2 [Eucalyptus grandis]|uniref:insulin-degrading enzyme-like 1, peroxisomal isoform X2 n=1 Tax=Eucalyptus grandis TaxID=71139 RepID=UPI00192EF2A5|nr:insulin-degrading enzyme-like 1, peroxisomal isoform X2 [Eucalyptus grandis]